MNYNKVIVLTGLSGACFYFALKAINFVRNVSPAVQEESLETGREIETESRGLKLKQAQVFFRHGARTPVHHIPNIEQVCYPSDILLSDVPHTIFQHEVWDVDGGQRGQQSRIDRYYNKKVLKGGSTAGALTRHGQDQMYLLGRKLAEEYVRKHQLIKQTFDPGEVYVRSTNVNRTVKSARCVLAGIFGKEQLNSLQELPMLYVRSTDRDELRTSPRTCPVLRQANHAALIHGGDIPGIKEDRLFLENILGIDSSSGNLKLKFIDVCDDLFARKNHGHPLPANLEPHFDMILKNGTLQMFYAFCGQHKAERPVIIRLSTGPLINMVQANMDNIKSGKSDGHKLFLYSCHDSTLLGIMGLLDIFKGGWPPCASYIIFELYQDEEAQEWVKVIYNGEAQIIRDCKSEIISLEKFKLCVKPYMITWKEMESVCHSNILEIVAKEMLEAEKGEIEDKETKERSDIAAGM